MPEAPSDAPLCAVRSATTTAYCTVSSPLVTQTIRTSAAILGPPLGFNTDDVSARSCRAGGAMALLCGRVDTSIIQLVGRWRSDIMLRYLHLQAGALMNDVSTTMLQAGTFYLIPGQDIPAVVAPLLAEVPDFADLLERHMFHLYPLLQASSNLPPAQLCRQVPAPSMDPDSKPGGRVVGLLLPRNSA